MGTVVRFDPPRWSDVAKRAPRATNETEPQLRRGRLITFEGGEGAGKTTQQRALAHRLLDFGVPVLLTREPGGTPGAEAVRAVLLGGAARARGPDAEALLFAAARIDHVDRVIRPALAAGTWVICDRYMDSTRVYQGVSGADRRILDALERIALDGVVPDLTFILDLPPRVGLERAGHRGAGADRFEAESLEVHQRRRRAFIEIARAEPKRCVIMNAARSPTSVAERVWEFTVARLSPAG